MKFSKKYTLLLALIVAFLCNAPATSQQIVEKGVDNVVKQATPATSRTPGNVDEGPGRWPGGIPENRDAFLPMPLPEYTPPIRPVEFPNRVHSYNLVTGEQVVSAEEELAVQGLVSDWVAGSGLDQGYRQKGENEIPLAPGDFSALQLVTTPAEHPWRVNCVVYTRFPDNSLWRASGTLIDPGFVITAGHMVHNVDHGGWATSIEVVPAYDSGVAPFGSSFAVAVYSWTAWTGSQDYDYDMGVIKLGRPIGALTGWHGFGYNTNCAYYTSTNFNNVSYPAATPYDGEHMYNRFGPFNDCPGQQLQVNTPSYGGMSGSSAYAIPSAGVRIVHGTLSTGNAVLTNFVEIGSARFSTILGWIDDATPASLDLIPLDVVVGPVTVIPGQQLSSLSYVIHNYSSASFSGSINYDVYLSTNDVISTGDIYLQSRVVSTSFGPKSSVSMTATNGMPTVPLDLCPGTYYVGMILNIADYNTTNNASSGQDASPLNIICPTIAAPTGCIATDNLCDKIRVEWNYVGTGHEGFAVYRNGSRVFTGGDPDQRFWDDTVAPAPGTYTYYVRAYHGCCGDGPVSNTDTGTRLAAPKKPTAVAATEDNCGSVFIEWTNMYGEDGYRVYRGATLIATKGPDVTSHTDVVPYGTYDYCVEAFNACGTSPMECDNGISWAAPPVPEVVASDNSCSNITIEWSNVNREDGYHVYRNGTLIATKAGDVTLHADSPPPGTYTYCVEAFNNCGAVGQICDNGTRLPGPVAPSPVVATNNRCNDVMITWNNVADEDGYRVYRNGALIATKGPDVTSHTDAPPAGTYNYCVEAYSACGSSDQSCNIGTRLAAPAIPTSVSASDGNVDHVLISWTDVAGEDGYRVYRDGTLIATKAPNTTTHTDIPGAGTYEYCVLAYNSCGPSGENCDMGTRIVGCLADGDVNEDENVTPQDALCAFWTYLYYPGLPPSECVNDCYMIASDVDCGGQVTPADALCIFTYYLQGTCIPDPPCNVTTAAFTTGPLTGTLLMDAPVVSVKAIKEGDEITVRVVASQISSLDAFGLDLEYPTTWLEFEGFDRAPATQNFDEVEAVLVEPGRVRVGGYSVEPVDASGESDVALVRFTVLSDDPDATLEIGEFVSDLARAENVTIGSADVSEDAVTSHKFALRQNHPNPFNPTTVIDFSIDLSADVELSIYDVSGQLVRTLVDRQMAPGVYSEQWDGRDQNGQAVASGIYLYRLRAGDNTMTRKMVLLK